MSWSECRLTATNVLKDWRLAMSKRFDNRKLIFLLAALLVILLLTVIVKIPGERSTLKGTLVEVDTSEVGRIIIVPRVVSGKPFEFVRENEKWSVCQDNIISTPQKDAIGNIFTEILAIKPQSLAAVGKSRWQEYELTDSLATHVKLISKKGRNLAEIMIGKFSYRQSDNPYAGYGGNNIEGTTYVRLSGEEEIYAVEGFLSFMFSGGFNDWRDKSFLRCMKEDIKKVTFILPADSSYTLAMKDSLWFAGNMRADSSKTANYLNSITSVDGQDFRDRYKPASSPEYQMVIEGNNLLNITVKCYKGEAAGEYILNSSLNPEVYFSSRREGIFDRLFKPSDFFL
jgi:hypothetical protein